MDGLSEQDLVSDGPCHLQDRFCFAGCGAHSGLIAASELMEMG